ncbi:DNA methyltransferase [Streptomyces sp. NBC_00154]|uniref:Eco57I restriction-modification methylase domain-containing protein n=1 Tax=Streptomyces sp. NBC_00154 TaxID=2975670 RepID=UPI002257BBEF|nr:DNA methyltransferase [Streptomyces sp. NBC_00154]MCX5314787.1 N-6 DNA methylase [Streptomyces sp. NBC_00154]
MSAATRTAPAFTAVTTVGGLLPSDMLLRIAEATNLPGTKPADYHLPASVPVRDEAERAWEYLKPLWRDLRTALPSDPTTGAPAADPTGRAGIDWLAQLFRKLDFGRLTEVGTVGIAADSDPAKRFPVSHRHGPALVHQIPWNQELDKRSAPGQVPAQSMLQECLNRTEAHLWAVLTNGRRLRLLRDSSALATAAYVEFDLEAIFDGELFSEFVLLYAVLHASRFSVPEGTVASTCWLERWRTVAIESGSRALDNYRDGVQQALTILGTGFLRHPRNTELRESLDVSAFQTALLRLVYRMIFLFVAEDRGALLAPDADELTRERFTRYFSTARLRRHALRRQGTSHDDQYRALLVLTDALGDEKGRPELGLPGLGGLFNDDPADAPLRGAHLTNAHFFEAVRRLARMRDVGSSRWRPVDYLRMGAEELGSVYEALLELVPRHSPADRTFELVDRTGNDRKKTGSYYTPSPLAEALLDSTLNPVIDDALQRGEQAAAAAGRPDATADIERELLSLTVCDPACGSGHFLVAAARRIAKRLASVRERNPEPTAEAVRHAMHEVVARCVYGVDLNPMAVELAKVSLWLEAMEPGRPLGFLDARIKHGNGLIGATPRVLRGGIPEKAFKAIEGDDEKFARHLATEHGMQRTGNVGLFEVDAAETKVSNTAFAAVLQKIAAVPDDSLAHVRRKEDAYRAWETSAAYLRALHIADAWCAAFTWVKSKDAPPAITHDVFTALQDPDSDGVPRATHDEIISQRQQYSFFHWHLAFPDVFTVPDSADAPDVDPRTGWAGGFSCVIGNPPWDKVDFEDKKYFAVVNPELAEISGVARRKAIAAWREEFPGQGATYDRARRTVKGTFHFAGDSDTFPLCAAGLTVKGVTMLQTDQLFAERFTGITAPHGRLGLVLPTAIATGAGAQHLFSDFTRRSTLSTLYDFENRRPKSPTLPKGGKWFESVDSRYKFALLTLTGRGATESAARLGFFLGDVTDLDDPERVFALGPADLALISPNTGTLPVFRTRRDAELTIAVHRRLPVLWNETRSDGNPWGIRFKATFFHMTDDSDLFRSRELLEAEGWELSGNVFERDGERMMPLYEAKMADFFNHRAADVVKSATAVTRQNQPKYLDTIALGDPSRMALPLNWIKESGTITTQRRNRDVEVKGVSQRLAEEKWDREWLCGWCDVTSSTNERTAIPAFLPRTAVGHKFPLMLPSVEAPMVAALVAAQSSLPFDYFSRQKIGGVSMGLFIWKQLPVPTPTALELHLPFLLPRVLELAYTAYDMRGLARDLGDEGKPFRWDEDRRAQLRAELDAYFFRLYGIDRRDTDYILESFQSESGGLKNNEIAKFGEYRTKRLVLAEYDRMAAAGLTLETPLDEAGTGAYRSTLSPPPGHGPRYPAPEGD